MAIQRAFQAHLERLRHGQRWRTIGAAATVLLLAACTAVSPATSPPPTPTIISGSPPPIVVSPNGTATARETSPPSTPTDQLPGGTPSSTPPPAPTGETGGPTVHTFQADVEVADPGDTITLSWRWSGADGATIYHLMPTGQLSEPFWQVEPTGSLQYTISPDRRNHDTFALFLTDDEQGLVAQATLQIPLRCPDEWFFSPAPDICPAGPATASDGAEQHFEHGVMLWNQAEGRIYVLFNEDLQPAWSAYTDRWEEGDPAVDPDIEPPLGFYQPVRGFGLIWREEPGLRERLGWAIDPERGYRTALQRTSHARYSDLYIRALGGGVWKLGPNGSSWEHLTTTD